MTGINLYESLAAKFELIKMDAWLLILLSVSHLTGRFSSS